MAYQFFIFICGLILAFWLKSEFSYVMDYHLDKPFNFAFVIPTFSSYVLLLVSGFLFKKTLAIKNIYLNVFTGAILVGTIIKILLIPSPPKETFDSFFAKRENQLMKIISENKERKDEAFQQIGFESLQIEEDTYIFIFESLLDNSHGILFDMNDSLPDNLLGVEKKDFWCEKYKGKWYKFSTT